MREVLRRLLAGELNVDEAEVELRRTQLTDLAGAARLDLGRPHRRGLPEVVLAEGKTPQETARLTVSLALAHGQGLASRLTGEHWESIDAAAAEAGLETVRHRRAARLHRPGFSPPEAGGRVAIVTAGTSDLDAAEEARMVVEACGHQTRLVADAGVAGLHRLLEPLSELVAWNPDVYIVAAGMDGVLPGVVSGLVDAPVVGLPVPTGYGAGGAGEAALLTMLQSCATGLVVVNIGNGVGAGAAAVLIASRAAAARRPRPSPKSQPRG